MISDYIVNLKQLEYAYKKNSLGYKLGGFNTIMHT